MAAVVEIHRLTGSGPTGTDITNTNTRASTSDDPDPGSSNPIPVPDDGTNYSFWVSTRLFADELPSGTINNIRWYTDGSNGFGTGVSCVGNTAGDYVQAVGTVGESGTELTTGNHADLNSAPVDVFTFEVGTPLAVAGDIDSGDSPDSYFGDLVVYQIAVADTAGPGATPTETFSFVWDET